MLTKRQCEEELKASMVDYFSSIEDPRVERTRAHRLASNDLLDDVWQPIASIGP